ANHAETRTIEIRLTHAGEREDRAGFVIEVVLEGDALQDPQGLIVEVAECDGPRVVRAHLPRHRLRVVATPVDDSVALLEGGRERSLRLILLTWSDRSGSVFREHLHEQPGTRFTDLVRQRASGIVGDDRDADGIEDRARVEAPPDKHDGGASFGIACKDGGGHGRRSAPSREERRVYVEDAEPRNVEDR